MEKIQKNKPPTFAPISNQTKKKKKEKRNYWSKSGICNPRNKTMVLPFTAISPIFSEKESTRPPST
jgi:hypothetical protein